MCAIPLLSGEKQTSGKRAKNDANDPKQTWVLVNSLFGKMFVNHLRGSARKMEAADRAPCQREVDYHLQLGWELHGQVLGETP